MHPEVHRYLDGELPRAALSRDATAELAEWESLEPAITERRAERAPPWLANDVMRALPQPRTAPWQHAWHWLLTPRPIQVPPFAPLAAAALIALVVLLPGTDRPPAARVPATAVTGDVVADDAAVVYVRFTLNAAGARTVAVAGDFNDWSTETGVLRDPDGDGVWSGLVAVRPGVHKYMFVVDSEEWVTDPVAESYVEDGFGMRNALLSVTRPQAET